MSILYAEHVKQVSDTSGQMHHKFNFIRNRVSPTDTASGSGAAPTAKHITLCNQVYKIIYRYTALSVINCKDTA